jgi:hypothetical protein
MTHHIEYSAARGVCKSSDLKLPIPALTHILSMGFRAFDKEYNLELIHRTSSLCFSTCQKVRRTAERHPPLPS